jgi:16S rRNA C967 or C1407 C5-methylase (RsmB/RsmF family)
VVERFLTEGSDFAADTVQPGGDGPYLRVMPHREGTDGFFIARLCRR